MMKLKENDDILSWESAGIDHAHAVMYVLMLPGKRIDLQSRKWQTFQAEFGDLLDRDMHLKNTHDQQSMPTAFQLAWRNGIKISIKKDACLHGWFDIKNKMNGPKGPIKTGNKK